MPPREALAIRGRTVESGYDLLRGMRSATQNLGETLDKKAVMDRLRALDRQRLLIETVGLKQKYQEQAEAKKQAASLDALRAAALAGKVPVEQAVQSGDPETVKAALVYQDFKTIPTLDTAGLKTYQPASEQGRILWQNRMAAADAEGRAADEKKAEEEKAAKKKEEDEALEVEFGKVKGVLRGKSFRSLAEAEKALADAGVDLPTKLFAKVKDYVVTERLAEDQNMRKEAADARAKTTAAYLDIATKSLAFKEKAFVASQDERERAALRAEIDDDRANLALEVGTVKELVGNPYLSASGKERLEGLLKKVESQGVTPTSFPESDEELMARFFDPATPPQERLAIKKEAERRKALKAGGK